jgi:stress-induced morphogen
VPSLYPGVPRAGAVTATPAGTIPPVTKERITALLEDAFPDAEELRVIDRGGGDHFEVRVTSPAFNGMSHVAAHKLIYAALADPWADGSIHELRINTKGTGS